MEVLTVNGGYAAAEITYEEKKAKGYREKGGGNMLVTSIEPWVLAKIFNPTNRNPKIISNIDGCFLVYGLLTFVQNPNVIYSELRSHECNLIGVNLASPGSAQFALGVQTYVRGF